MFSRISTRLWRRAVLPRVASAAVHKPRSRAAVLAVGGVVAAGVGAYTVSQYFDWPGRRVILADDRRRGSSDGVRGGAREADAVNFCALVHSRDVAAARSWLKAHAPAADSNTDNGGDISKRFINTHLTHPMGWTALHVACANRDVAMARFLLDAGADPNAQEQRPQLGQAGMRGYVMRRREEFSQYISPLADTRGFTPLHYAVVLGDESLLRLLLDRGADPTIKTAGGHVAADFFDVDEQPAELLQLLDDAIEKLAAAKKRAQRELRRKYPLEQKLREAIVGQLGPINSVAAAIRRKENGWADEDRPLVFLFLGSSGIGKTELAKQIAKYHNSVGATAAGDKDGGGNAAFIRLDMSEFQSKHEVSKFIGSPPGYVGFEEGGQLTSKLKENPNAVVLLDEVEKAHIDVLTIMLQVFDEGRLTDGKGNTVDCRDAIFIMTSNLAQHEIADEAEALRREVAEKNEFVTKPVEESSSLSKKFIDHVIYPILRDHFKRDEFLGRINEVLYFLPFTRAELMQIVEMELSRWKARAQAKHNVSLTWTPEVVEKLSEGYNIRYGARSIKHEVEKRVINQIARAHEQDQVGDGGSVQVAVDAATGHVTLNFDYTRPAAPTPAPSSRFKLW